MHVTKIDHLGIVAGVLKDLNIAEKINSCIAATNIDQEFITTGDAVVGMIVNGLGFTNAPLSLTPRFFKSIALEQLFRPGVEAEHFNRYKLARTLDAISEYGGQRLFYTVAGAVAAQENVDKRFVSLDTTSISVTGEYDVDSDENTIRIVHGYSKDHRPDLKQLIQELLVSQDGGVPLMVKCWDGNASDSAIFKERAKMLIQEFKQTEEPRYLVADSKLYHKDNIENLSLLQFITRIPGSLKAEKESVAQALSTDVWQMMDARNKYQTIELEHYGMTQRWIVVYSKSAQERAEKTVCKNVKKEAEALNRAIRQLKYQAHDCSSDAEKSAHKLMKSAKYHKLKQFKITEKKIYSTKGHPRKKEMPGAKEYYIKVNFEVDQDNIEHELDQRSCFVVGTNIDRDKLTDKEVVEAYKRQNASIENMGFRFLKDPLFFTSSLLLKKPSRIMGLIIVMNLALLVYAIAQRRLRKILHELNETIPNQINQPIKKPTMRWVFQIMNGIFIVRDENNKIHTRGLDDLKIKIIKLMGRTIMEIYCIQLDPLSSGSGYQ